MIYTATMQYHGADRLDVTVKSANGAGAYFAPTWGMVMGFKKKLITWEEYTTQYYKLLQDRRIKKGAEIDPVITAVAQKAFVDNITFVCFCKNHSICHRSLLATWFVWMYPQLEYAGERLLY